MAWVERQDSRTRTGRTWQDAGPEANPGNVVTALGAYFVIANGADVIMTVATADLTAGDCDFHAF